MTTAKITNIYQTIYQTQKDSLSSLKSDDLSENLIRISQIIYKYKNAQRNQKVYQFLRKIKNLKIEERVNTFHINLDQLEKSVKRRMNDAKNNKSNQNQMNCNNLIESDELKNIIYSLLITSADLASALKILIDLCQTCYSYSKKKITAHSEFVNYHLLVMSITGGIHKVAKQWESEVQKFIKCGKTLEC